VKVSDGPTPFVVGKRKRKGSPHENIPIPKLPPPALELGMSGRIALSEEEGEVIALGDECNQSDANDRIQYSDASKSKHVGAITISEQLSSTTTSDGEDISSCVVILKRGRKKRKAPNAEPERGYVTHDEEAGPHIRRIAVVCKNESDIASNARVEEDESVPNGQCPEDPVPSGEPIIEYDRWDEGEMDQDEDSNQNGQHVSLATEGLTNICHYDRERLDAGAQEGGCSEAGRPNVSVPTSRIPHDFCQSNAGVDNGEEDNIISRNNIVIKPDLNFDAINADTKTYDTCIVENNDAETDDGRYTIVSLVDGHLRRVDLYDPTFVPVESSQFYTVPINYVEQLLNYDTTPLAGPCVESPMTSEKVSHVLDEVVLCDVVKVDKSSESFNVTDIQNVIKVDSLVGSHDIFESIKNVSDHSSLSRTKVENDNFNLHQTLEMCHSEQHKNTDIECVLSKCEGESVENILLDGTYDPEHFTVQESNYHEVPSDDCKTNNSNINNRHVCLDTNADTDFHSKIVASSVASNYENADSVVESVQLISIVNDHDYIAIKQSQENDMSAEYRPGNVSACVDSETQPCYSSNKMEEFSISDISTLLSNDTVSSFSKGNMIHKLDNRNAETVNTFTPVANTEPFVSANPLPVLSSIGMPVAVNSTIAPAVTAMQSAAMAAATEGVATQRTLSSVIVPTSDASSLTEPSVQNAMTMGNMIPNFTAMQQSPFPPMVTPLNIMPTYGVDSNAAQQISMTTQLQMLANCFAQQLMSSFSMMMPGGMNMGYPQTNPAGMPFGMPQAFSGGMTFGIPPQLAASMPQVFAGGGMPFNMPQMFPGGMPFGMPGVMPSAVSQSSPTTTSNNGQETPLPATQNPMYPQYTTMNQPGMYPQFPMMQQHMMQTMPQPMMQQPMMQQPLPQPTVQQPLQQPMMQELQQPTIQQPTMHAMQQPMMHQPAMQQPMHSMQQPTMQQFTMQDLQQPMMQQPTMHAMQQPRMQQPTMHAMQQHMMQQPWMHAIQQPMMQQPVMQQAMMQQFCPSPFTPQQTPAMSLVWPAVLPIASVGSATTAQVVQLPSTAEAQSIRGDSSENTNIQGAVDNVTTSL